MPQLRLFRDSLYRSGTTKEPIHGDVPNLKDYDRFADITTSVIVDSGTWTLYVDNEFKGLCVTVSAHGGPDNNGQYPTSDWLGGLNDKISSVRLNSEQG